MAAYQLCRHHQGKYALHLAFRDVVYCAHIIEKFADTLNFEQHFILRLCDWFIGDARGVYHNTAPPFWSVHTTTEKSVSGHT